MVLEKQRIPQVGILHTKYCKRERERWLKESHMSEDHSKEKRREREREKVQKIVKRAMTILKRERERKGVNKWRGERESERQRNRQKRGSHFSFSPPILTHIHPHSA